jgi:hypothetical protein
MGIDQVTRGQVVPSIVDIRKRMQKTGSKTTNTADAKRCVDSFKSIPGRRPLRYVRLTGEAHLDVLDDAIKGGEYAHLAISYGVFNDKMDRKTGDPGFRKGHSVGVFGWKRDGKGIIWWRLWDPLDDRRRPGIPKGSRWVRKSALVAALKSYGSYFGIIRGGEKE